MNRLRKYSFHARRFARDERGSPAVEFAMIMFLVLTPLLLGIMQFGFAFFTYNEMMNGAREGARQMAVSMPRAEAELEARKSITLDRNYFIFGAGDEDAAVKDVTMTVELPLSEAMVLGLPKFVTDRTITARVTMRKEY